MNKISDAELEIMKILWIKDSITSIEIIEDLIKITDWNKNTIKTLISRLVNKNAIKIIKNNGKLNRYKALITEIEYKDQANTNFIKKLYNGSINNMILNFVNEEKLTKNDLQHLIDIIESEDN